MYPKPSNQIKVKNTCSVHPYSKPRKQDPLFDKSKPKKMLDEKAPSPQSVDFYRDKSQPQQIEAANSTYNNMIQLSPSCHQQPMILSNSSGGDEEKPESQKRLAATFEEEI